MMDLLLNSVEYGGYISPVKLVIFLILFFSWLLLTTWVYRDARQVATKEIFWTAIVLGTGAAAVIIWLLMPLFVIGLFLYLAAVAATSVSYVMHRNTKVATFDRILTPEHIRGLLVNEKKKISELKGLTFVTANNNEVPIPEFKTPEFFSFKTAFDFFTDAIRRRASDVMFSPAQQDYSVTYYIDGAASKQPAIVRDQMEYIIRFLKNIADLDVNEKRKPQKGSFVVQQGKNNINWEITTAGSTAGEQIQLKQIGQQHITRLADISLAPDQYEQLNHIRDAKQGLFIIAGPGKSGVTTTFYAMIRNHDPYLHNIHTLERKPTAELVDITQNVFALSDTGTTTFAKKLQAVIRTEPDIVGVADCPDAETAKISCAAAKDGKIVYLILEADNVIQALGKWIKLVGNRDLAVETLLGISNQRLIRKLCENCKQAYEPNKELLKKFNIPAEKAKILYRPGEAQQGKRGKVITCEICQGTGYVGRICIFEVITLNDEMRNAIKSSKSLSEVNTQFRLAKMLYLQEQALKKVIDGTSSINEMVRIFSSEKKPQKPEPKD